MTDYVSQLNRETRRFLLEQIVREAEARAQQVAQSQSSQTTEHSETEPALTVAGGCRIFRNKNRRRPQGLLRKY